MIWSMTEWNSLYNKRSTYWMLGEHCSCFMFLILLVRKLFLSVSLSVNFFCPFVCLSVGFGLFVYLSKFLFVCLSVHIFCPFVCLSVVFGLFVCLFISCLFIIICLFLFIYSWQGISIERVWGLIIFNGGKQIKKKCRNIKKKYVRYIVSSRGVDS